MTLSDNDKARVLARFRSLHGRGGVRISFVSLGPTVLATDPDEFRRATINSTSSPSTRRESARARSDDDDYTLVSSWSGVVPRNLVADERLCEAITAGPRSPTG